MCSVSGSGHNHEVNQIYAFLARKFGYDSFKKRITQVLISLCGCAGWSVPLFFASTETGFFALRLLQKCSGLGLQCLLRPRPNKTRAAVDGTPSQIPAFFTYNLYLWVKVTQNVAQYLLHNVTYAPVKFEVDMSNG